MVLKSQQKIINITLNFFKDGCPIRRIAFFNYDDEHQLQFVTAGYSDAVGSKEIQGIYNEAHFHEAAKKLLEENPDTDFVMTCSSAEKFRVFKELFGQEKYDDYLIRTAESLKTGLVHIPKCKYGRIGESDFYIIMPKEDFDPQRLLEAIDEVAKAYSTNNFNLLVSRCI